MLSIKETHALCWTYLLYRSLDQEVRAERLTYKHLRAHVHTLLRKQKRENLYTERQQRAFCVDLSRAVNNIPTPFSCRHLHMNEAQRERLAFEFVVAATQEEGVSHIYNDALLLGQFSKVAGITPQEAHTFFEYIITCVHLGIPEATLKAVS